MLHTKYQGLWILPEDFYDFPIQLYMKLMTHSGELILIVEHTLNTLCRGPLDGVVYQIIRF